MSQKQRHRTQGELANRMAVESVGGVPFYLAPVWAGDGGAWIEIIDPQGGVTVHFKFADKRAGRAAHGIFRTALTRCSSFSGFKEPKTVKNYEDADARMTAVQAIEGIYSFAILNADGRSAAVAIFMDEDDAREAHALLQGPLTVCVDVQCGGFSIQGKH